MGSFTDQLRERARELGFQLAGVCPAVTPQGLAPLAHWLEAGYAGEMSYFVKRREAYEHPRWILDGARSLLVLGMSYYHRADQEQSASGIAAGYGRVARYAASAVDYHDHIHTRLKQLCQFVAERQPGARARGVVDTAPLLEREFAQLAGLGWVGKNTMLLNRTQGSWFFLAAVLLDCELDYDAPHATDHCGTCTACLDACPTRALPHPYVLDATRCISYLTIELRTNLPPPLRTEIGDWLFGCDICQDVCPWNRKLDRSPPVAVEHPFMQPTKQDLHELFTLDEAAFRQRFRRTALWRSRRRGLLRNAAIVLGNQAQESACATLALAIQDQEPLVRSAAAWALGRIGTERSRALLQQRDAVEQDPLVREEIQESLLDRNGPAATLPAPRSRDE